MRLTSTGSTPIVTTDEMASPAPSHPDLPVIGPLAGAWTWNTAADRWWWSDEMFAIHGFTPGEVVPSTELMLAHKVLEDLQKCRRVLASARTRPGRFCNYHRIIDTRLATRHVLTVGDGHTDASGRVDEVTGYMVDLTDARRQDLQPAVEAALAGALEHRTVIDLAKGAIMAAWGVDADTAFEVLRTASSVSQLKLREVAQQLVEAMSEEPPAPATATHLDALLQRITR